MTPNTAIACLLAAALAFAAAPVRAQWDNDYNIMTPEKGAPAKKKSAEGPQPRKHPRGSSTLVTPTPLPPPLHFNPSPVPTVAVPVQPVPPSLYVPQTGQTLPNLPGPVGNGPGGAETSQDRAVRCAHQAGVYGPNMTGNPSAYIGTCINQ